MTRKDFIAEVALRVNATKKDIKRIAEVMGEVVRDNIHDENGVSPFNGVTFCVQEKSAHNGFNPSTGEHILISARVVPRVRFGKAFKEAASEE